MKKIIAVFLSLSLFVAVLSAILIYSNQKAIEKKLYSSVYSLSDNFLIEAENGCANQDKNSIEYIKTAISLGANCIEVDLSFDKSGYAFLAPSNNKINSKTLSLDSLLKYLSENTQFDNINVDLHIRSADNLKLVDELCQKYNMTQRVFFTGINLNQAFYVKSQSSVAFYVSIDLKKDNSKQYLNKIFNDISSCSAKGILCDAQEMTKELSVLLEENWIDVMFVDVDTHSKYIKALTLSPRCIRTSKPYELLEIVQNWQNNAPIELYGLEKTTIPQ